MQLTIERLEDREAPFGGSMDLGGEFSVLHQLRFL
jgi:hypothetical protein